MYPMLLHHHQTPLGSVWVVSLHMTKLLQQVNVAENADCLLTGDSLSLVRGGAVLFRAVDVSLSGSMSVFSRRINAFLTGIFSYTQGRIQEFFKGGGGGGGGHG